MQNQIKESIFDKDGKILIFSLERFKKDICEGDCCFICGESPSKKEFSNEHIIPDWIINRISALRQSKPTLSNKTFFSKTYKQFIIPCCLECNKLLGAKIEKPVRELINQGEIAIKDFININGYKLFYVWLALIFFKFHYKDKFLLNNRDTRISSGKMSDDFPWKHLYHVHNIARLPYTNGEISQDAFGTFYVVSVKDDQFQKYDHRDFSFSKTIMLRVDNIALIASFIDYGIFQQKYKELFRKIRFPITRLQLLELTATINIHNSRIMFLPWLYKEDRKSFRILRPDYDFIPINEYTQKEWGECFYSISEPLLNALGVSETIKNDVKEGKISFLFNEKGDFIDQPDY